MDDIVPHLLSGFDNADRDSSGHQELGGVLLTMHLAAEEIIQLRSIVGALLQRPPTNGMIKAREQRFPKC